MIQLLSPNGAVVREFANKAEAMRYCMDNKICNKGWVRHSIKTGKPFYIDSKPWKDYNGYGYRAVEI